jgi:hypothetical protein
MKTEKTFKYSIEKRWALSYEAVINMEVCCLETMTQPNNYVLEGGASNQV